eukprot:356617-Chlamydomonas_euryale.AAC.2
MMGRLAEEGGRHCGPAGRRGGTALRAGWQKRWGRHCRQDRDGLVCLEPHTPPHGRDVSVSWALSLVHGVSVLGGAGQEVSMYIWVGGRVAVCWWVGGWRGGGLGVETHFLHSTLV